MSEEFPAAPLERLGTTLPPFCTGCGARGYYLCPACSWERRKRSQANTSAGPTNPEAIAEIAEREKAEQAARKERL